MLKIERSELMRKLWQNPQYRNHMKEVHKGFHPSLETRLKMSESAKKLPPRSAEYCRHISESRKGKGQPHKEETKIRISKTMKERRINVGEKNPIWNGGSSFYPYCELFNIEFKYRVRRFFNFTCCLCGKKETNRKHSVHHIHYDKKSCCDPVSQRKFILLCTACHLITNDLKTRDYWISYFEEYLALTYGNKCYYTQKEMKIIGEY